MKNALAAAALLASLAFGQPAFQAADIRPSAPNARSADGGFSHGGRFEIRGATILDLIAGAYDMDPDKVVGGPGWVDTDRFDIVAQAPPNTSEQQAGQMLKTLLADRFKVVVHKDRRDLPVFVLTVDKKGSKLKPAADPKAQPSSGRAEGDPAMIHRFCKSCTIELLAGMLPQIAPGYVNHEVIDETHLKGAYDFQLDWMGAGIYRQAKANPDGPPAIGMIEALESLGLHLEEARRPQEVLAIDSVNRQPTPNPQGVTVNLPAFPTEFEVAEVRPAKPQSPPVTGPVGRVEFSNGRIQILAAQLSWLIPYAFDIDPQRLVGAPKWFAEDRFDVIAKTEPGLPDANLLAMLRQLLVERFALATHTEEQPLPVYVLEAGKAPKLTPSDGSQRSNCEIVQSDRRYFVCKNTTMAQFAERLPQRAAAYLHPPVLDLTGIAGAYDFQLYWTPRNALQSAQAKGADAGAEAAAPVEEVTVFEAVDKQLGLKLEEQKRPVTVTVVDSVLRVPKEQ